MSELTTLDRGVGAHKGDDAPFLDPRSGKYLPRVGRIGDGWYRCSRCGQHKPPDAFRLDAKGKPRSHCKPCAAAVTQEWRDRVRPELNRRRREQRHAARPPRGERVH